MRVIDYISRTSRGYCEKRLESYDNVLVKTGTRVASIDQTDTGVNLLAHSVSTDTSEKYRAQYVIGCDGANSQTRTIIQSELDDYGFQEKWLVIDLILKNLGPTWAIIRSNFVYQIDR